MSNKLLFALFISFSFLASTFAQDDLQQQKSKLQQQNAALKKELANLNTELQKTQSSSKTSLVYIQNLQKKINAQDKLVRNLSKEKRFVEDEIYLTQLKINELSRELVELKKEYKKVLLKAYKNKSVENKLLFVLSSESLTQAYRRIKYLEKYSEYQLGQADEILAKTTDIKNQRAKKEAAKKEKEKVLAQQTVFKEDLDAEKAAKERVVAEFKKNAGVIANQIAERKARQKQIDIQIKDIINEEIRLAKIRAEKDQKAWQDARKQNTIAAYKEYLKEWGNGDYANLATRTIEKLEADNRAWQSARASHSKSAYQTYINNYPQGQFASTARIEIGKFEKAEEDARIAKEKAEREALLAAEKAAKENNTTIAANTKPTAPVIEKPKPVENPKPDPAPQSSFADRSSSENLSSDFAANKGRLPWPVDKGSIVGEFGVHPHPVLSNLTIDNGGVDIATNKGSNAKAIFEGQVTTIIAIPGGNRTVLIRHGSYYTVYNNLSFVSVQKGDRVKRGQSIGRIYTNSSGDTILNFELRSGANRQNPASWIGGM